MDDSNNINNNMEGLKKSKLTSFVEFLKKNPIYILGGVFLFLILVLIVFALFPQKKNAENELPLPTKVPLQALLTPGAAMPTTAAGQPAPDFETKWEKILLTDEMLAGFELQKEILPNGSIKYTYDSQTPGRPDMAITENGWAVFMRTVVYHVKSNNYTQPLKKPDYYVKGSRFWGVDKITYIFFERGLAIVVDPKTNDVLEEVEFRPVPPSDYKKLYGEDLIGELTKL